MRNRDEILASVTEMLSNDGMTNPVGVDGQTWKRAERVVASLVQSLHRIPTAREIDDQLGKTASVNLGQTVYNTLVAAVHDLNFIHGAQPELYMTVLSSDEDLFQRSALLRMATGVFQCSQCGSSNTEIAGDTEAVCNDCGVVFATSSDENDAADSIYDQLVDGTFYDGKEIVLGYGVGVAGAIDDTVIPSRHVASAAPRHEGISSALFSMPLGEKAAQHIDDSGIDIKDNALGLNIGLGDYAIHQDGTMRPILDMSQLGTIDVGTPGDEETWLISDVVQYLRKDQVESGAWQRLVDSHKTAQTGLIPSNAKGWENFPQPVLFFHGATGTWVLGYPGIDPTQWHKPSDMTNDVFFIMSFGGGSAAYDYARENGLQEPREISDVEVVQIARGERKAKAAGYVIGTNPPQRFDTLEQATEAANKVFRETGNIVAVEKEKEAKTAANYQQYTNPKFPVDPSQKWIAEAAAQVIENAARIFGYDIPGKPSVLESEGFQRNDISAQIWGEDNGWGGGIGDRDRSERVYIAWEEGPFEWVHGYDEFGGYKDGLDAGLPKGIFLEPVTGWMLGVYDDRKWGGKRSSRDDDEENGWADAQDDIAKGRKRKVNLDPTSDTGDQPTPYNTGYNDAWNAHKESSESNQVGTTGKHEAEKTAQIVEEFDEYGMGTYSELGFESEDVDYICQQGQNDTMVAEVMEKPYMKKQLDDLGHDTMVKELAEYGAWDDEELANEKDTRARYVWTMAWNAHDLRNEHEAKTGSLGDAEHVAYIRMDFSGESIEDLIRSYADGCEADDGADRASYDDLIDELIYRGYDSIEWSEDGVLTISDGVNTYTTTDVPGTDVAKVAKTAEWGKDTGMKCPNGCGNLKTEPDKGKMSVASCPECGYRTTYMKDAAVESKTAADGYSVEECVVCNGSGDCQSCGGKGCDECYTDKEHPDPTGWCDNCRGTGKIEVNNSSGVGRPTIEDVTAATETKKTEETDWEDPEKTDSGAGDNDWSVKKGYATTYEAQKAAKVLLERLFGRKAQ